MRDVSQTATINITEADLLRATSDINIRTLKQAELSLYCSII